MTKLKNLFAVMLAVLLSGCAIHLAPPKAPEVKPAGPVTVAKPAAKPAPEVAIPAKLAETRLSITSFPSSKNPTKGKTWTEMGLFPYKGMLDEAIAEMPLDTRQKGKLKAMFASGECMKYDIKDGEKFAVDWLNFTSGGVHKNRANVASDLKKLPSKVVTICDLGDGVYAGQFDGCQNFFVSFSTAPTVASLPGVPATEICPQGRALVIWSWDITKMSPKQRDRLTQITKGERGYHGDSFPRIMGGGLRQSPSAGERMSRVPTKYNLSLADYPSGKIVRDLGEKMTEGGGAVMIFSNKDVKKQIVLTFAEDVFSPPKHDGVRQLKFHPQEWGNWCLASTHFAR
ncbi:MAG: hypothetical protein AAB513_01155 [Patescibacteria group bacterium]